MGGWLHQTPDADLGQAPQYRIDGVGVDRETHLAVLDAEVVHAFQVGEAVR